MELQRKGPPWPLMRSWFERRYIETNAREEGNEIHYNDDSRLVSLFGHVFRDLFLGLQEIGNNGCIFYLIPINNMERRRILFVLKVSLYDSLRQLNEILFQWLCSVMVEADRFKGWNHHRTSLNDTVSGIIPGITWRYSIFLKKG